MNKDRILRRFSVWNHKDNASKKDHTKIGMYITKDEKMWKEILVGAGG